MTDPPGHDALTGLLHRPAFTSILAESVRATRTGSPPFALLVVDLDRFRIVNESLGPSHGDALLAAVARRLEEGFPDAVIARMGGDEFGILLASCPTRADAEAAARRLAELLGRSFSIGGHEVYTGASIGVVVAEPRHAGSDDVLREAEAATHRAKALGRGRHEVFTPVLQAKAVTPLQLETELRRAVDRRELRLRYQPIVALDTGALVGFEALLRWQHPDRGLLGPDAFLALAEEGGLILPIGTWAVQEACRQAQAWRRKLRGLVDTHVSVNLSGRQFSQPDLLSVLRAALDDAGLDGPSLLLEITESVLMEDPEAARRTLATLRGLQVRIVLDDFGTGYSSLSHLHEFPIDMLKIDRSFVARMGDDGQDSDIVRTIIHLARHMRLAVVAEGVETPGQLARLRTLRCDWAQGYHFAPPLEPDAAEALLSSPQRW